MPTIISGTTGIDLIKDSSIVQADLGLNVTGNGPAFSAYLSANQTVTASAYAKVAINTKEFDTNSNFDVALSRFTPTIAGYYQISFAVNFALSTSPTRCMATLYKNSAEFKRGSDISTSSTQVVGSVLVYMNGTTDFVELFTYIIATTAVVTGASTATYFQAFLARSA